MSCFQQNNEPKYKKARGGYSKSNFNVLGCLLNQNQCHSFNQIQNNVAGLRRRLLLLTQSHRKKNGENCSVHMCWAMIDISPHNVVAVATVHWLNADLEGGKTEANT